MKKFAVGFSIALSMIILNGDPGFANGFKILGIKSAKATAMGEAFIVQADDPSAIAFNPAGLTQLEGTQISAGAVITNAWVEHTSPRGEKEDIIDKWQIIPGAFITSDFGRENIAAGIGITVPNGMSTNWSETGFARYVDTFSSLTVIDVNPSLAYQINDNLSVGGGISYYYSTATLENMVDYGRLVGLPGALDGKSKLEANGDSWGYNLGVLYKLTEQHSFAATFKSPYKIEYKGNSKLTNIPAFMGLGSSFESLLRTSIKFPAIVVLGYAYRPIDRLKLEFDLDWTNWDTLDSVTVHFYSESLQEVTYMYQYENTFAYKFGLEYLATECLKLRAGYIYNENAVPERNWRPSLPDTDMHFLCSGFGYSVGNLTIDGAAQVIFYEDRDINNNVDNNETLTSSSINGRYETFALGFSLGVTYKFG